MSKISKTETGKRIRKLLADRGITVRKVQDEMELESPQAVYKWLNGKALPSMENLLVLSKILKVPMEELLVQEDERTAEENSRKNDEAAQYVFYEYPAENVVKLAVEYTEKLRQNEKTDPL